MNSSRACSDGKPEEIWPLMNCCSWLFWGVIPAYCLGPFVIQLVVEALSFEVQNEHFAIFRYLGLSIASCIIFGIMSHALLGASRFGVNLVANIIFVFCNLGMSLIFIDHGLGVAYLVASYGLSSFVGLVFLSGYFFSVFGMPRPWKSNDNFRTEKRSEIFSFFKMRVLGAPFAFADRIIVGSIIGLKEAGALALAQDIPYRVLGVFDSLSSPFVIFFNKKDEILIKRKYEFIGWLSHLIVSSVFLTLGLLAPIIIQLWLGPSFRQEILFLFQFFCVICSFKGPNIAYQAYLLSVGDVKALVRITFLVALILIFSNLVFVPLIGIWGVCFGVFVSGFLGYFLFPYFYRTKFDASGKIDFLFYLSQGIFLLAWWLIGYLNLSIINVNNLDLSFSLVTAIVVGNILVLIMLDQVKYRDDANLSLIFNALKNGHVEKV